MISEPFQVLHRVVQPVDVVDTQSRRLALVHQPDDEGVGGREHLGVLHSHAGEVVHVEEAPVV